MASSAGGAGDLACAAQKTARVLNKESKKKNRFIRSLPVNKSYVETECPLAGRDRVARQIVYRAPKFARNIRRCQEICDWKFAAYFLWKLLTGRHAVV
jgi:hypothetical protein